MKNAPLAESIKNAFNGFTNTLKNERNFKIHVFAAVCAVFASFVLKVDALSFAAVIFAISAVLTAELINTAVEAMIDLYCGEVKNSFAKTAKDAAAAAVLIASVFAVIIGLIVFGSKILNIFNI